MVARTRSATSRRPPRSPRSGHAPVPGAAQSTRQCDDDTALSLLLRSPTRLTKNARRLRPSQTLRTRPATTIDQRRPQQPRSSSCSRPSSSLSRTHGHPGCHPNLAHGGSGRTASTASHILLQVHARCEIQMQLTGLPASSPLRLLLVRQNTLAHARTRETLRSFPTSWPPLDSPVPAFALSAHSPHTSALGRSPTRLRMHCTSPRPTVSPTNTCALRGAVPAPSGADSYLRRDWTTGALSEK